jgi:hypothetical protein
MYSAAVSQAPGLRQYLHVTQTYMQQTGLYTLLPVTTVLCADDK